MLTITCNYSYIYKQLNYIKNFGLRAANSMILLRMKVLTDGARYSATLFTAHIGTVPVN